MPLLTRLILLPTALTPRMGKPWREMLLIVQSYCQVTTPLLEDTAKSKAEIHVDSSQMLQLT
jgi:hypothetical protein